MENKQERSSNDKMNPSPNNRMSSSVIFFLILLFILFFGFFQTGRPSGEIAYSTFLKQLHKKNIKRVIVSENHIEGILKKPLKPKGPKRFSTTRVAPGFAKELEKYGVAIEGKVQSRFWQNLLIWTLPMLILLGFWFYMMRRMSGQGVGQIMSIGKNKAKVYAEKKTGVSFDDVAGLVEAKNELEETTAFLKNPRHFSRLGAKQPKGILLIGPPGTGKTLLARAVAGEANVPFFSIGGSEFVEMFVGVGAARVRDLFEQARKQAPCIVFVDELDALGRARSAVGGGIPGNTEKEQTLNQLLNEMDGFDPRVGVVILAATNQPQVLDPALLRPGRFDRQVVVDRPAKRGRLEILKVHVRPIKLSENADLDEVASLTAGFSGADLANLVNEAAIIATRRDAQAVETEDFTAAIERVVAGMEQKSWVLREQERSMVAHHEMGHALVAWVLPDVDKIHKVSIIPRSVGALGYTMQSPTEDHFLSTEKELRNKLTILFGGRAAEQLCFDDISTGASDDVRRATEIARSMVVEYGMDDTLGPMAYEQRQQKYLENFLGNRSQRYSDETGREIDEAIRRILSNSFERSFSILSSNRATLENAAQTLLREETLENAELKELLGEAKLPERSVSVG